MKNTLFIALFLTLLTSAFSQTWETEILDSRELILDGLDLHKEKKYAEAIAKYDLVLEGDTNYHISILEKTNSLLRNEQYDEAIAICKKGLAEDSMQLIYYINLGNSYDNNGQLEKSIEAYSLGEKYFPMNYVFAFNKGIAYEKAEQYDQAVLEYQRTLKMNPFHDKSHIRLAALSRDEGKLTQAAFGLLTYLILNPETMGGQEVLGLLSTYLTEKPSYTPKNIKFSDKGDDFEEIDDLLKSQVALNKKYVVNSDLKYSVIRQSHALLTLLKDYEGDGGFYDEFYVPFYQDIMAKNLFEGFSYFIASSSSNETVKKAISKNEKDIVAFATWLYQDGFVEFRKDDKGNFRVFYDSPFNLNGIGDSKDDKKVGKWTFYHSEGTLMSIGEFEEGEKTGVWNWYYLDGSKEYDFIYVDGEKNGPFTSYYPNGNVKEEGTYKDGKLDGEYKSYFSNGGLEDKFYYKEGKFEGKQTVYQANGALDLEIEFEAGIPNGFYKGYYPDGSLYYMYANKDGEKDGLYESFYADGSKEYTGNYKEGLLDGDFVRYFRDGTIHYKGTAKNGNTIGHYVENYSNGALFEEIDYDESGKMNGVKKEYDIDGKLYLESTYVKGEQSNFIYYDKKGAVIIDQKVKNNQVFKFYFPTGELKGEGKLAKGERDGPWTFYYKNGSVQSTGNYSEGKMEGKFQWYHENGELSKESVFEDDMEQDFVKAYYINGQLRREGRANKNEKVGPWKYYNEFGILTDVEFYVNGEINGPDIAYDNYGHIDSRYEYELGELVKFEFLDTLGIPHEQMNMREVPQEYKVKAPFRFNDQAYVEKTYMNGDLEGAYNTFYPNGELNLSAFFKADERHGKWTWKFIDGTPDYEITYEFGDAYGLATSWSVMGYKFSETNFFEDERNGLRTRYFPNGKKFYTQEYMEDDLNGYMTYFDQDGNVSLNIFFQNNLPIFYVKDYFKATPDTVYVEGATAKIESKYANGQVAVMTEFDNGLEVGDFKIFDKDGNTIYHSELKNDYIDGQAIYYFPGTNKKMIVENYKYGERHGTSIRYTKEGKEFIHIDYQFGNKHGEQIIYDESGKVKHQASYYDGEIISLR